MSNTSKAKNYKHMIMVSVFIVVSLNLGYQLMIKPQWQKLKEVKNKTKNLNTSLRMEHKAIQNHQLLSKKVTQLQGCLEQMLMHCSGHNFINILDHLSHKVTKLGLELEEIKPASKTYHDFYTQLPIRLSVKGSYLQFLKLIDEMNASRTLIVMSECTLDRDERQATHHTLSINFLLNVYQCKVHHE